MHEGIWHVDRYILTVSCYNICMEAWWLEQKIIYLRWLCSGFSSTASRKKDRIYTEAERTCGQHHTENEPHQDVLLGMHTILKSREIWYTLNIQSEKFMTMSIAECKMLWFYLGNMAVVLTRIYTIGSLPKMVSGRPRMDISRPKLCFSHKSFL